MSMLKGPLSRSLTRGYIFDRLVKVVPEGMLVKGTTDPIAIGTQS